LEPEQRVNEGNRATFRRTGKHGQIGKPTEAKRKKNKKKEKSGYSKKKGGVPLKKSNNGKNLKKVLIIGVRPIKATRGKGKKKQRQGGKTCVSAKRPDPERQTHAGKERQGKNRRQKKGLRVWEHVV